MELDEGLTRRQRPRSCERGGGPNRYPPGKARPTRLRDPFVPRRPGLSHSGKSLKGEKTMCDYSLMHLPNRLAAEGEVLMTHKFPIGSIGLATPDEVQAARTPACQIHHGFWGSVKKWFASAPAQPVVCAVCVPPGALLRLYGIPEDVQRSAGVSAREEVTFTELTAARNQYRDAVRFMNGQEVLLQRFGPGVGVQVLRVSLAEAPEVLATSQVSHR